MKPFLLLFLFSLLALLSACSPYGNAVNKAFCKPLEKEYRRAERHADRNYPDVPYLLHGVLLDSEDHAVLPHATVSSPSLSYGRLSGWQGEFTLEIPDSLFVKDRFLLEIEEDGYDFPGMEVNKKMFKANEARLTIYVPRRVMRLD